MTDYFCRVCGFLWAAIGESLWCPKCETTDIEQENNDESISEG